MDKSSSPFAGDLQTDDHDHDRGLAFDLVTAEALNRRRALRVFGLAGGSLALAACGGDETASASASTATATPTPSASATPTPTPTATASSGATCTAFASETNGPYPADGTNTSNGSTSNVLTLTSFQRSDIRASVGTGAVAPGVPVTVTLRVVDVNNSCAALAGYAVYLWHCDAVGDYSLYDTPNESWLRGIQITDANGQVTFTTIFPGCYAGRYPHMHFELFTSLANATGGRYARLISQIAMPADECAAVYADTATYGASGARFANTSIATDGIFRDNSAAQQGAMILALSGSAAAGYTASATVGIAT